MHRHYIGYANIMTKPNTTQIPFTMKTYQSKSAGQLFRTAAIKVMLVVAMIATGGAIALAADGFSSKKPVVAEKVKEPSRVLYNKVRRVLHCPDFIGDQIEKAEIWLHVNEDGSLVVKHIRTTNSQLAHYIMKGLDGKSFVLPIDEVNKDYHFALSFQII